MSSQTAAVADVLLDGLAAIDPDGTAADDAARIDVAMQRLEDVGAFTVQVDPDTDDIHLDLAPLIAGSLTLARVLVGGAMQASGLSYEHVIAVAREWFRENPHDP